MMTPAPSLALWITSLAAAALAGVIFGALLACHRIRDAIITGQAEQITREAAGQ